VAKYFNDYAMEMCSLGKGRLHALAQVPLQDIDAACKEASRAMSIGHKGIQIGNHVGPLDLDNHKLVTFLHHCADDDVSVNMFISVPSLVIRC
jgi:aminocarboxymuconate-semialdehyde decarboxylase